MVWRVSYFYHIIFYFLFLFILQEDIGTEHVHVKVKYYKAFIILL
jgi:hypothetical protein